MSTFVKITAIFAVSLYATSQGLSYIYRNYYFPGKKERKTKEFLQACEQNNNSVVENICKEKGLIDPECLSSQIVNVAENGHYDLLCILLKYGSDNITNAIYAATNKNHSECVVKLLSYVSSIQVINRCLMIAVKEGHYALVDLFLESGADPSVGLLVPGISSRISHLLTEEREKRNKSDYFHETEKTLTEQ